MGQKQTGRFCPNCKKNVMAVGSTPNHILHLILSILTGGLWIIVWIIIAASKAGDYKCTQCGTNL